MALNFSSSEDELLVFSKYNDDTPVALNEYKILNLPFQFNNIADPRVSKNSAEMYGTDVSLDNGGTIGRMYDKHIIANSQILIIRPGRPKFMQTGLWGGSDEYKAAIEEELAKGTGDDKGLEWDAAENMSSISEAILSGDASDNIGNPLRYYDFEQGATRSIMKSYSTNIAA